MTSHTQNLAFAAALGQLYREGNPKVSPDNWNITVHLARARGPTDSIINTAIAEGLDRDLVLAIAALTK